MVAVAAGAEMVRVVLFTTTLELLLLPIALSTPTVPLVEAVVLVQQVAKVKAVESMYVVGQPVTHIIQGLLTLSIVRFLIIRRAVGEQL